MLLLASARAAVLVGGAWAPVGIGALAWQDGGGFSGTLSGEFDGLLRPPLSAHVGWVGQRDAILGGLALVRFDDTRSGDSPTRQAVGGTRIAADYRRWLHPRAADAVGFFGDVGLHGVLGNAAAKDAAFTAEEQDEADAVSADTRARVGGVGGQLGLGAEYVFADGEGRPSVSVGIRSVGRAHLSSREGDDGVTWSIVVLPEVAFLLEFTR